MATVLLFDVDGTLVDTGGAGRRALERAFVEQCGSARSLNFDFSGMTDGAIVRAGLQRAGQPSEDQQVDQLLDCYLGHLSGEVERSVGYTICPGIKPLLALARQRGSSHALGLGTGNLQRGAQIKLARAQLANSFDFGGFGCDHEDRAELIRIGAERGARRLGVARERCRVVVIGDTPRDVAAARAIGAECVAVATGPYGVEQLEQTGATVVLPNLDSPAAAEAVLGT